MPASTGSSTTAGVDSSNTSDGGNPTTDPERNDANNENPKDLEKAQQLIDELRLKCRSQAEQIMAWKKAYTVQKEQHNKQQKQKSDQLSYLTSQLLLLESRLIKKQKQIANLLYQREMTIYRQQRIIDSLSSRLVENGMLDPNSLDVTTTDFDSLNDSDSAVVLEDIDSDFNMGFGLKRRSSNEITIMRSISDAIDPNLKYGNTRRSNCFLRRPDVLETVYSVEEDSDQQNANQQQLQQQQQSNQTLTDVAEKRDKFRNRALARLETDCSNDSDLTQDSVETNERRTQSEQNTPAKEKQATPNVMNYNRVMLNHRAVTKVKDVKYKRINKAKSKSLEELRGRLRHWVDRGSSCGAAAANVLDPPQSAGVLAAKTFA